MLSTTWRAVGSFTLCVAVACGAGDAGHVRSHPIEGGIGYSLNAAELHFAEVPAESLTHGVALGDTSTWSFPGPSRIVGRWLVVADQRVAPHFTVADLARDSIVAQFGDHGHGPGEFMSITWILPDPSDAASVWAFDQMNRRFSRIRIAPPRTGSVEEEFVYQPQENVFFSAFEGDTIIGTGALLDATLVVTDRTGHLLRRIAVEPPFTKVTLASSLARRMANSPVMAVRPVVGGIALGYYRASRLDFFDGSGAYRRTLLDDVVLTRKYDVVPTGQIRWSPESEMAYLSLYGTELHVYALFCGCAREAYMEGAPPRAVRVLDWAGRPVMRLAVDRGLSSLAVSEDDRTLVGITRNPMPGVIRWRLPAALAER